MHGVLTIAATEVRIGLRNRWIVLSSLILLAFALILVLLGSAPTGEVRTDGVTVVVASLATLSVYLVPLIALLFVLRRDRRRNRPGHAATGARQPGVARRRADRQVFLATSASWPSR